MSKRNRKQTDEKNPKRRKYAAIGCIAWALKDLWRLDKKFIFFIFATVPLAVVIPLLNSYFPKLLIDSLGAGTPFQRLALLACAFLTALTLLNLLASWIRSRCMARRYYPTNVYHTERGAFIGYETDFENLEKQEFQKILGYVWGDASNGDCSREFVWQDISKALIDLAGIAAYASLLVLLKPLLLLVLAGVSAASYFFTRMQPVYYEKNKQKWEKETRKKNYLQGLSEDFSRAKDIKLYGLENWLEQMMRDYQAYILTWNKRCSLRGLWAAVLSGLMAFLQNGAAYFVLIGILLKGGITVGDFVFYFGLVAGVAGFLQGIITDVAKLNTRADKIAYWREFFDYPNRFNRGEGCALPTAPVTIELKDVWYRYDGAEDYTLKGINLTVQGGEKLALVGMNGAGKTTLIKLICGMYTPTRGEILVGGKRIDEYNIEEYYAMISAVFQEVRAVAFTCFEFVASADLERPTAREDAIAAMQAAGIYDKVQSLQNGMDTHLLKGIYDDGVDLSGGELQKLVLARAIYKDGAILVLDEPTAALDPIAENNLYLQYQALTAGKTSVYISHRFASTRFCDRIVLLEDGVITESGSHGELMEKNGQYANLFNVQSQYYKEEEVHA